MEKCSPEGRDCIEKNSLQTFNCSETCEGVYADVLWEEDTIMNFMKEEEVLKEMKRLDKTLRHYEMYYLESEYTTYVQTYTRKMNLMKGEKKNMAEEKDKENFKKLISEYKTFKMENVRHFRFHPNATHFGKSSLIVLGNKLLQIASKW